MTDFEITPLDDSVKQNMRGQELLHAPYPALTTRVTTAWASSGGAASHLDAANSTRLDNMDQRILDIENALKALGLLK